VADYAGTLLGALRSRAEFNLPPRSADRWLYHIGNNREYHADIYRRALREPGVVVLHDAVLIHLLLSLSSSGEEFAEEFVFNYGGWYADLARRLWHDRARSGADATFFQYPMLKRIADSALGVVVHNPKAAALVRDHAPAARIFEIPHFDPGAAADAVLIQHWRRRCGFPQSTYLFGIFGHLRETKRILPVLRSFARLQGAGLILAGRFQSAALRGAAEPFLRNSSVRHFGYLAEQDLRAVIALVDCGVNLRWPASGETSGIALRLMSAGKPVLLTRGEEVERYPEGSCVKVDAGPMEEDLLVETMRWLVENPSAGRRIGALAREHVARHHSLDRVAGLYLEALNS
jgi:glycosyltransferase involved in cell wall biosynthesis